MRLTDHAGGRPGAQATKDAGYDGSVRYLANSPERGLPNKILLPEEAREYMDLGLALVSNWQKGKGPTADFKRGFEGGRSDAAEALEWHFHCGGPGYVPIFFSIDEDVSLNTWNELCAPYLKGCASILGKQWVGVYGGLRSMYWAEEDDLVGDNGQGKLWLWQTKAWSTVNGVLTWHPKTVLRQELVVPPDFASVANIPVDVNTTHSDDFGQWKYDRGQKLENGVPNINWANIALDQMMGPIKEN